MLSKRAVIVFPGMLVGGCRLDFSKEAESVAAGVFPSQTFRIGASSGRIDLNGASFVPNG